MFNNVKSIASTKWPCFGTSHDFFKFFLESSNYWITVVIQNVCLVAKVHNASVHNFEFMMINLKSCKEM